MLYSRAVLTNVKYKNAWLNWKKWEKDNLGVNVFPVSPYFLSLYLIDKFQSCNSPFPMEAAVYGVKSAHVIAGVPSPVESTLVRQVLEAAKRLLDKPVQGKQALSFDVITKVVEKFNTPLASLSDLRTCFIFVIAFAGMMRSHEIINIKRSQISILPDHLSIFCPVHKNDQRRQWHLVFIARSNNISCPVSVTEKLLAKLPVHQDHHLDQ